MTELINMTELIDSMLEIAEKEVGIREGKRNNTGARIVDYQGATGLAPGAWAWCAAFTAWVMREWLESQEVRDALHLTDAAAAEKWRCRDASAFGWERWARGHKLQILSEHQLARKGDFVVFDFSHIGIVRADQAKGRNVETIEGNTNGKGERDSHSGDGVWEKSRAPSLTKSYIRIFK